MKVYIVGNTTFEHIEKHFVVGTWLEAQNFVDTELASDADIIIISSKCDEEVFRNWLRIYNKTFYILYDVEHILSLGKKVISLRVEVL